MNKAREEKERIKKLTTRGIPKAGNKKPDMANPVSGSGVRP
jgi:hypothetical protein